ncbi:ATP-binding protein [Pantoea sp. SS70]|uniref:ATP-binding protein n=1 Tax=Pantoea sp. SS70 TaxID=3024247 RepID=UPI002452CC00|nr:ATP-binding protein [Pantoea sp. SS70]WGK60074.1 ATP-binding protein [Pantoea sp. SS70]
MQRLLLILLLTINVAQAKHIYLPPLQQAWIKAHPDITYTVTDRWPQDYRENGKPVGLSRTILDEISKRTGLHFTYVAPEEALLNPPMLNAAVSIELIPPHEKQRWLFTQSWVQTMPMLVGRKETMDIRSIERLDGKRLGIAQSSEYESWIRKNYPAIKLVDYPGVSEALRAVNERQVDAVIGSGLIILPILQRYYAGDLAVAGQVPEMASGINMAIDPAYPELRDIINAAFITINGVDAQNIFKRWVGIVDLGSPSIGVIVEHYRYQLIAFATLLLLLLLALRSAINARRQAQASERNKSEFLAIMSHEIRTPMNAIIASLELLQQPTTDKKQQEYQALALSSSQDLLELLNNVLDHTKLIQQEIPLHIAPCEVSQLLAAVCDSQRPSAERIGVELILDIQPALETLWLEVDAHRLRQIVNNLLSNAVKFTDSGTITLKANWQNEPELPHTLTLSVEDTGIGIAPADQQRMFQAWQQAESRGARVRSGSGLGLYLCRTLAKRMGGDLTLSSEEGKGSVFTCILPLNQSRTPDRIKEQRPMSALPTGLSVLVVEDHPANQQVLAAQLTQLNCDYEMVESAEQALQLLEEENYYDLMLLDCNLPGKDGYWLAEQIRQFEMAQQRDHTPLVAISAVSTLEHRQRCLTSGMDDVLVKPIRLAELVEKLGRYFAISEPDTSLMSDEVMLWLQQDRDNFVQACGQCDVPHMIHFVHRIRGVAQMYQLDALAQQAEDIETHLRQQPIPAAETLMDWQAQIDSLMP